METCVDCQALYEELSDPNASMHLCRVCWRKRQGLQPETEPLQQLVSDDDWWTNFVYQYERDKILTKGGDQGDTTTHQ